MPSALRSTLVILPSFVFIVVFVVIAANSVAAFGPLEAAYPIECWGAAVSGPLPTGSYTQLALGDSHACALTAANSAVCWGETAQGQNGLVSTGPWTWIVAGYSVSCGLHSNGTARCFGLADARSIVSTTADYYGLAMQSDFGCAITQSPGETNCWGVADQGEVSDQPTDGSSVQVATGVEHACRLKSDGSVLCWGNPADGRLNAPTTGVFSEVCAGSDMSCALQQATGNPVCWGNAASLVGTPSDQSFSSLACGSTHVCGIVNNSGSVVCWGNAASGALTVPGGQDREYKLITASKDYTCGLFALIPSPSTSPSPLALSPSPTPSSSPAAPASSTPTSSPAPPRPSSSASASASAVPAVLPLTANASASFSDTEPTIDLSASSSSSSSGGSVTSIAVRSSLQLIQVGDTAVPALTWVATNGTTTNGTTTGKTYEAQLGDDTNVTQAFSFNGGANSTAASFSGLDFVIAAGSVKWSVNFTSSSLSSSREGITLRYRLSDLAPSASANDSTTTTTKRADDDSMLAVLRRASHTPRANMTTYYLVVPSSSSSSTDNPDPTPTAKLATVVMIVEVFDVALVDDAGFVAIDHRVEVVSGSNGSSNSSYYELVLAFPRFNRSLAYDPSIGLGVLLGSSRGGDGGGSDGTDVGLIVGVVVSISVAAIVVLVVITVAVALAVWRKKRHHQAGADMVNFVDHGDDDQL